MVHVFTDGRILFQDGLLRTIDKGKYVSVAALPEVEVGENQDVIFFANLEKGTVEHKLINLSDYEDKSAETVEAEATEE